MSDDMMTRLYEGKTIKDKELLFIRDDLEIMSNLLQNMGDVFRPFFLEASLRLEQVNGYLYSRNVKFKKNSDYINIKSSQNIDALIKNNYIALDNNEKIEVIEHLENIQISASKLGARYSMLDKYIFSLLEMINLDK